MQWRIKGGMVCLSLVGGDRGVRKRNCTAFQSADLGRPALFQRALKALLARV